jgi:hypothetical protein
MKKIILLLLLSVTQLQFAQEKSKLIQLGIKAGINYSNYTNAEINTDAITSFHGGFIAEIKLLKNFALQPELYYSTQGATIENLGDELKNELGYVSIPLLAKFYLTDNLSFDIGPQASFLLSERNEVTTNDTNSFDFAVVGGLGYDLGKHFFIQGRYGLGLTEAKRDAEIKNSVLQASIGYKF